MTENEKRMLELMQADGSASGRADDDSVFDWGVLGEKWWREAGAQFKASNAQIKFACAKHRGMSNAGAARDAGYAGSADNDIAKQSGYKAFRTTSVQNLLAFAAAEAKGGNDGTVDGSEARRILSGLARGSDPAVKIRAIEALQKLDERAGEARRLVENDGFLEWRLAREYLTMKGGGAAFLMLWRGQRNELSALPLLHDFYNTVGKDAPDVWERCLKETTAVDRACVERRLSDPRHQLDARLKLWREIGVNLDVATQPPTPTPLAEPENAAVSA